MKSLCKTLAVLCLLPLLASCEQIIGLEDRVLVEDGSVASTQDTALCKGYCTDVMSSCKAPNLDAYTSEDNCLSMCSFMPQGKPDASETSKNTASCRAHYAHEAASVESDTKFCPAAAPGGGSPSTANTARCGDNCESYCGLYASICPDSKQSDCPAKCRALPDPGKYSASTDYMGGDTIQCRIAHLTAAAQAKRDDNNTDRKDHCGHALLRAGLGERPFCDVPNATVPNCTDYCKLIMQACGDHKVYDSVEQCEKFCDKGLEKGTNTVETTSKDDSGKEVKMMVQDQTKDTLACRRWHGYYAYNDMEVAHCPHGGPTGDGHCGMSICQVYCATLERGCEKQFDSEFPMGQSQCVTACKALPGVKDRDMGYDLTSEEARTDTLQCRFRQLVDAFNDVAGACDRALPKGVCSK
jgi:hypothetical protein